MDELQTKSLTPVTESPTTTTKPDDGEVVKCSGNAQTQRNSKNLLKTRTRSRLLDHPTPKQAATFASEVRSDKVGCKDQLLYLPFALANALTARLNDGAPLPLWMSFGFFLVIVYSQWHYICILQLQ
ncbi:unnamed protein product [Eruca vesicaria subsp. sativa]|uniref:Uncharacterized protein n=1 Tax=Eruca vesicaria subsp. sativa TaxID=29727 RepID=A0ABC8M2J3_ERUVS|nr:unnamed protein product [Eruca vesicaria subsp. sativa]